MARNIIIMDSSASMRRIIRTMIQATVNDAVVSEAVDVEEAEGLLADAHYHLVIFSKESSDQKWLEFAQKQLALPEGRRTNFIPFSSTKKQDYIEELKRHGLKEYLTIPCAPNTLGELITKLCTPFSMRKTRRYSFPDAIASLEQGSNSFPAEVVNFSEGGVLCELDAPALFNWSMPVMINMEFCLDGVTLEIPGLYSVARRLMVVDANPDYSPRTIRLACRFISIPEESKHQLGVVFQVIEKQESELGHES